MKLRDMVQQLKYETILIHSFHIFFSLSFYCILLSTPTQSLVHSTYFFIRGPNTSEDTTVVGISPPAKLPFNIKVRDFFNYFLPLEI